MMNPYIQQAQGLDQQGLAPVFQNIAQQQASQNAALNEQNQMVNQAGQTQNPNGFNALAMALALRKGNKPETTPTYTGPSYGTNPSFDNSHFNTMSYD